MNGGTKGLVAVAAFALAGCAADDGKLDIRAIADPLSAASKRGSPMIVEGRTALALGNVGTALEAFRKAVREQPNSIEALAGIAACYERMGRFDLSRVNYEAALALAPNNPVLLNSFAASLQLQGRHAEAASLRAEAAQAEAADVAVAVQLVKVDAPQPPVIQPAPRAAPAPAPAVAVATLSEPAAPAVLALAQPVRTVPVAPVAPVKAAPGIVGQPAKERSTTAGATTWKVEPPKMVASVGSITVALPDVRPADAPVAKAIAVLPPAAKLAKVETTAAVQPRLQRLSHGEVALLTGRAPAWRAYVTAQTQRSVTARFVPLKIHALAARPNIRLLNAARFQGLAARTRTALMDRGWRKIAIGDAAEVRARSIVLYPAGRQALGRRLAAQFGFASAVNGRGEELVVLLGRDAPALSFRRARG